MLWALHCIKEFATVASNFKNKQDDFKSALTADSVWFEGKMTSMERLLGARRQRYKESKAVLAPFNAIRKANANWKMCLAQAYPCSWDDRGRFHVAHQETIINSVPLFLNRAMTEPETNHMDEVPRLEQPLPTLSNWDAADVKVRA
jgi:hypothetical protein